MRLARPMAALLLVAGAAAAWWLLPPQAEPPQHTVARGDSLGRIAGQHGITLDDLRRWNELDGDVIHPGQVLVVGEPAAVPFARLRGWLPRGSAEIDPDQDGLAEGGSREAGRGGHSTRGGARTRAGPLQAQEPPPEDGSRYAALSMPEPQPCLAADTGADLGGDQSVGRSVGLSGSQVRAAVQDFQPQTLRCTEGREGIHGTVVVELAIGCDGRVRRATPSQDTTGDPAFAACVADTLRYAPFPVHARDEVEVAVPLDFSWD